MERGGWRRGHMLGKGKNGKMGKDEGWRCEREMDRQKERRDKEASRVETRKRMRRDEDKQGAERRRI
jgi:hypothetical protein